MIRVYNKNRTFLLTAQDGTTHVVPPMGFDEIEEKFTGDITFRTAVKAGEIEVFDTKNQGEAIEKRAHESGRKAASGKKGAPKSSDPDQKASDAE